MQKKLGTSAEKVLVLEIWGTHTVNWANPRKAIEYYEQALKISKEIGDKRGDGNSLGNLGLAYSQLGETRKAIEYHEQALKVSKEIRYRRSEGADLGSLGNAYRNLGESRKAIEYCEEAIKIAKEMRE